MKKKIINKPKKYQTKKPGFFSRICKKIIPHPPMKVYVLFAVVFAILSVVYFDAGLHNADMGQNMRYLEAEFGLQLLDKTSRGTIVTGEEAYIIGINYMRVSFFMFGIACFMAGIYYGKAKD